MNTSNRIRVALFDDNIQIHKVVVTLLQTTPDIRLVGQGSNGQEALDLCEELRPDVVLMDVLMPVLNGIDATRRLRERFPAIKILVLSNLQDHESVYEMIRSGAAGYVIKTALVSDLADTIRAVFQGKMVFSPEAIAQLIKPVAASEKFRFNLTDREMEVLKWMAEGLNNPEIARKLTISQSTVKFHQGNICNKLGVRTRSEALIFAARNKLI
jgi:NarL family two-component system response regulator LiaR